MNSGKTIMRNNVVYTVNIKLLLTLALEIFIN